MINIPHYNDFINSYSNYFFDMHNSSASLLTETFMSFTANLILVDAYAKYLEKLDYQFFNSQQRKLSFNVKHIRSRSIDTTFGTITFKRRVYQHKITKKYFYYIDNIILNLTNYQRLSNELIANIFNDVTTDSYQSIASKFSLSKSTIYNLIKKFNNFVIDLARPKIKVPILYVQADECYISLQKKKEKAKTNKVMIHHLCVHQGLENVSKGRNQLVNKLLFTKAFNETIDDFYTRIHNTIDNIYEYDNLYFYGDGAHWIKSCCNELSGTFILDLFHSYQAISRICKSNKQHIDNLIHLCQHNKKAEFIDYIDNNLDFTNFSDYQTKHFKYLKSNWDYIQRNYTLEKSVGCSQEGINYHSFASRLTTTPKGFSEANARFIAQLICMKNNKANKFNTELIKLIEKANQASNSAKFNKENKTLNISNIKQCKIAQSSTNKLFKAICTDYGMLN